MYYADEIVEEVRNRTDIVDLIGGYVALKKKGTSYFGLCPFHGEKTPSFSVSPGKQIFYCFGCGKGGDAFRFLMEYENITFQEAIVRLAEKIGYALPEPKENDPSVKKERDIRLRLLEVNKQAAIFFHACLKSKNGVQGMRYFEGRGLSAEGIVRWGLGYAPKERDALYRFLRGKGYEDALLREAGLFSFYDRGVYDKFFNRVMFPIMDYNNRVIGFGGRVMGEGEPKYLNSPETKVFDKSRNLFGLNYARRSREKYMLLCEGYMDVISMHEAGFGNAVASLGTSFTEQQAIILKRYVSEVVLTYDSDGAGIRAAKRAIPMLREAGISSKVLDLSPCKDPDEFVKTLGKEAFSERIGKARNAFLWEADVLRKDYDLEDPAGQTAYTRKIAEMLAARFAEPLERDNYMKAVAREQMIDYDGLRRLCNRIGEEHRSLYGQKSYRQTSQKDRSPSEVPIPGRSSPESPGSEGSGRGRAGRRGKQAESGIQKSVKQLLTWLAERPEITETVRTYVKAEDLSDELAGKILDCLYEKMAPGRILDKFREDEESYQRACDLLNGRLLGEDYDEQVFRKGLSDVIRNIRLQAVNEKIQKETDAGRIAELFREEQGIMEWSLGETI